VEFLKAITSTEALGIIASFPLEERQAVEVSLDQASGMVLAGDIVGSEDIPPFSRSLVDGYAVRAKDTYGARETTPALLLLKGNIRVGEATDKSVSDGEAIYVATGAMLPEGTDGVVMQEHTRQTSHGVDSHGPTPMAPDRRRGNLRASEASIEGEAPRAGVPASAGRVEGATGYPGAPAERVVGVPLIEVLKSLRVGENICFKGEDVQSGQTVLERGRCLSPFDTGVLAALGITRVTVYPRPVIGLVSSGDEVVPPDTVPPPGKIRDINTHTVSNLLTNHGCLVRFAGIAKDTLQDTADKLTALRDCDMMLLSGGSSKGQSDFMTAAIEHLGGKILFHGLNIKPGKPTIFATLWGKPVFGLPGHPVSCAMVVLRFVFPLIQRMRGSASTDPFSAIQGRLTTNIPSSYGIEEYVRVTVEKGSNGISVSPIFAKSSVISMLSKADGYIVIAEGKEGWEAGEEVEVHSFA
jgi:molybdopterin molybdotransferase